MKTLSLNPQASKWRPAAVAVKKLDRPFIRANGEVVDCYSELRPNERKLYRKAKLRRDAEREMKLFQKILTTEADLAQAREELKAATDNLRHKEMQYHIKHIYALERKLAKLRGVKAPKHTKTQRPSDRVSTRLPDGSLKVSYETRDGYLRVYERTPEQIAEDKLLDMQNDQFRDRMERGAVIASLEGYQEGTHAHLCRASDHVNDIAMIERLQAFEDVAARYGEEVAYYERLNHFGGVDD